METMKKHKKLIILGVALVVFIFYWADLRPQAIRKECALRTNIEGTHYIIRDADFQTCVRSHGLKGK